MAPNLPRPRLDDLADFEKRPFSGGDGTTRDVYVQGAGPAIIVIAEVPGITPAVANFARRCAAAGYTAVMPSLFGKPGKPMSIPYSLNTIARACIAREFTVLATKKSSPIIAWLRDLARHAHAESGGPGVGVVGMCFTGNFALAMMAEPSVLAPVLSQPSLPFGITSKQRRSLHVSPDELRMAKSRCAAGAEVMGLRFTGDAMVPAERFAALKAELGESFIAIEIDSSRGNPHGIPRNAHSVLTEHLVDTPGHPTRDALDAVFALFSRTLAPESAS